MKSTDYLFGQPESLVAHTAFRDVILAIDIPYNSSVVVAKFNKTFWLRRVFRVHQANLPEILCETHSTVTAKANLRSTAAWFAKYVTDCTKSCDGLYQNV